MRKCFVVLLLLSGVGSLRSQQLTWSDSANGILSSFRDDLFLVCRATKAKAALIAGTFNQVDTSSTHVALGFYEQGCLRIYSVEEANGSEGALRLVSLDAFVGPDTYHLGIWSTRLNRRERQVIKNICDQYLSRRVIFDYSFELDNGDTLYCSEFCAGVLNKTGIQRLRVVPASLELNNRLIESFLKRKRISYFPVDFFRNNPVYTMRFECGF